MLFDHGPAEFPEAHMRPREARGRAIALLAAFERWIAARWSWLKPRTVPCAVAGLGMLAVLASADYLAHQHGKQSKPAATVVTIELAPR